LLTVGLVAMLAWSFFVSASMPSWFDPDYDCTKLFYAQDSHGLEIHTQWLPPKATCDFGGGQVRDFISPARTNVLMVIFVLIALVTLLGLYFVVRRLFEPAGIVRSAEAVDLGARQRKHLATGGVLTLVVAGLYVVGNIAGLVLAGPPGGITMAVIAAVSLATIAAAIDRSMGPLPSTALDSRRRGTAVGLAAFASIIAAPALTGQLPFFKLWVAPVAAVVYVVLTAVQWSRLNRADRGTGDGDTVEQDLLGSPRA
jgi:membrane protein implicated in regulation of membrane protease activity